MGRRPGAGRHLDRAFPHHRPQRTDVTIAYPELAGLALEGDDALVDGEIVALRDGRPSFEALQPRMHVRDKRPGGRAGPRHPVVFLAFDLLRRYGVDLTDRPYRERRATLERWLEEHADWTVSPVFDDGRGHRSWPPARTGWRAWWPSAWTSRYRPGRRSPGWLKLRFVATGDFVVVGWEASPRSSGRAGSLLLAVPRRPGPTGYAGKVGTGFDRRVVRGLQAGCTRGRPRRSSTAAGARAAAG